MLPLNINQAKQGRHVEGSTYYVPGRSILIACPEMLVSLYARRSELVYDIAGNWSGKERFVHTETIGVYKSFDGKVVAPTNVGIIHYSQTDGVHIVPARPQNLRR